MMGLLRIGVVRRGHGRRGFVTAAFLVLPLLLGACAGDATTETSGAAPREEKQEPTAPAEAGSTEAKRQPDEMTDASIQTTWFAQPEQGGSWLAQEEGLFKERNVNGTVEVGGPGIDTIRLLATGQVEFAYAHADQVALARNQGIPVVGLLAGMEKTPQIVMVHEESGITTLEEIGERSTRVYVAGTSAPIFQYLVHTRGWSEEQSLSHFGQIGDWLVNPDRAVVSFLTNDPFNARAQGVDPVILSIPDLTGFNPYTNVLLTTPKTIQERPELVHAVVEATLEGWHRYLADPDETLAYIKERNPDVTDEWMRYNFETLKNEMVLTGDVLEYGIGVMTKERWDTLYDQLKQIGMIDEDLDPDEAWTDEFFKDVIRPFEG